MDIPQIRYFLEVSSTLNFTAAAENMHISQPAFSRQIKMLEEEVGAKLLIRDNKNVVLTEAGKVFRNRFSEILNGIDDALEEVINAARPDSVLRVGILDTIQSGVFIPFIEKLQEFFNGHEIQLFRGNAGALQETEKRGLDMILINNTVNVLPPMTEKAEVCRIHAVIVVNNKMAEQCGGNLSPKELSGKNLVSRREKDYPGIRACYSDLAKALAIDIKSLIETGAPIGCLSASEADTGFTFFQKDELKEKGYFKEMEIPETVFQYVVSAAWKKEAKHNFSAFIKKYFS